MDTTVFVENLTEEQQVSLQDVYQKAAEGQPEETSFGTPHDYPNSGKKKGRKPKEAISEDAQAMDLVAAKAKEAELSTAEVDKAYLPEGETYNLHITMERARFYQAQAANSLIELGKQLLLLKHHEPHGQFVAAVEELGLAYRSAAYAMTAAQKFSNVQTFAGLARSKQIALTVLDDDSIKNLEDGGVLVGVGTLDDIERMTVGELKAALREEKKKRKEERDAQEAAISQKEKKLNELEMELRYREPPTKEELAQAALDELKKKFFLQVGEASHALHNLMLTIVQAQEIPDVNITQLQGFITLEPEGLLSSIFDYSDTLDEMIENICPAHPETNTDAEEMQYAEPVED
nr:MAG TPA: Protein of unknown function (DUF3102) [Caudoviricetes sp.]